MISFVETKLFTRLVQESLSDDEYSRLQQAFGRGPRTRFGHCRLRRGAQNALGRGRSGKRGGLRIIYFLRTRHGQIWMLTLYAKNVAENIPAHVLRQIKDEIDG